MLGLNLRSVSDAGILPQSYLLEIWNAIAHV